MNIPNLLTAFRFLLIPAFIYYFFSSHPNGVEIAVGIFILAGITDTLDGYIARKFNQITRIGIVLDPLADKLMLVTVLVSVTISSSIPFWIIALVIVKEGLLIIGAISLYNDNDVVIPANVFGKVSTVLSYIAILAVMFELPFNELILYAYVASTVMALIVYLNAFLTVKKQQQLRLIKK